jgi:hypothetical protein
MSLLLGVGGCSAAQGQVGDGAAPASGTTTPPVVAVPDVDPAGSPPPIAVPPVAITPDGAMPPVAAPGRCRPEVARMAEWLLGNQDEGGALADYRGGDLCNLDSGMEYALLGLAAAYEHCGGDARHLAGLERGIRWLAARQDRSATAWRGSWAYVYSCTPPYPAIALPQGGGVADVRGVDATSALFPYLLYVHRQVSGSGALAEELAPNARAALDFLLARSRDAEGFFYSSWGLVDGAWALWPVRYSADQADVYLGMRAGSLLFDGPDRRYRAAADHLARAAPASFFHEGSGRFAVAKDEPGELLFADGDFNGTFAQGYIPWALGPGRETEASLAWLRAGVQPDGSVRLYPGDPGFSLSAALLALGAASTGGAAADASVDWIVRTTLEPDGGVQDSPGAAQISNVTAFAILAAVEQLPFEWRRRSAAITASRGGSRRAPSRGR